jgi:choline dehydrogenase
LKTTNPFDYPLIDPKYHSDPQDVKVMGAALREFHRIASSSPQFKEAANFQSKCKACAVTETNDCEEFFECLAKEITYSATHLAGSCRMGSATDPKAVVDERLRVRGIENVRVIDASIMPQNTEPGTYAATVMIGEKGAQMIIEDTKE